MTPYYQDEAVTLYQVIDPRIQGDPIANRLHNFGDTLRKAKTRLHELEALLKTLDEEAAALTDAGVTITYTLGPVGDAAASTRRDLQPTGKAAFEMPRSA